MRLTGITAVAHPDGNRIDLSWTNPAPAQDPSVRVVRRVGSHPEDPDDGVVVAEGTGLTSASDTGLQGETVYYYTLFPFHGSPQVYDLDPHNRTSAMAIASYDFAGLLYASLPAVYRRYDAATGQLRRFLDLPGGELNRLYSLNRAALAFTDLDRVDDRLLPLLGDWIGWPTNFGLPVRAQRTEIRSAPSIYQTLGAAPNLDATVARITSWANRTKEFVHNVARTNQPERLNLWYALRGASSTVTDPALASVNFAYDGRPAAVREADGSTLFFYHTKRRHGWDVWAKRFAGGAWQPSGPVVDRTGIDKHPSAAITGDRLWLFWQGYDPDQPAPDRIWRIWFTVRTGGVFAAPAVFGDPATERRMPTAVADDAGGLWLFWLESINGTWEVRYNRHDGTAWQLADPQTLPPDAGQPPRVEDDLFVLVRPGTATKRLWLFWARHEPGGPPGQTRWSVVYRIKQGLDPTAADWSPIRALPKTGTGGYYDRQPAGLVVAGGNLDVYVSSTQNGGWTVVRNALAAGPLTWGAPQQVVAGPYARRGPLAVDTPAGTLLMFRSNQSLTYASASFGATRILDDRYAGTTTVDTGWTAKLALRGTYEDFQTYTYDAGHDGKRTNDDRIARDTVGLYLTPGSNDPAEIKDTLSRLAGELPGFLPVTTRAVFITP
jgi:phage tail-like protein